MTDLKEKAEDLICEGKDSRDGWYTKSVDSGKKTDPENKNKGEFIDKEGVERTALRVGMCKYKSLRKLTDDKPLSIWCLGHNTNHSSITFRKIPMFNQNITHYTI